MVTSYVPADPLLPDRSVLRGPRPVSDRSLLYHQWACYRLASLQAQVRAMIYGEASCMINRGRVPLQYKEPTRLKPDSFAPWPGFK